MIKSQYMDDMKEYLLKTLCLVCAYLRSLNVMFFISNNYDILLCSPKSLAKITSESNRGLFHINAAPHRFPSLVL